MGSTLPAEEVRGTGVFEGKGATVVLNWKTASLIHKGVHEDENLDEDSIS